MLVSYGVVLQKVRCSLHHRQHVLGHTWHQALMLLCLAGACWCSPDSAGGRLLVLGTCQLFDDKWLDKEDNSKLMDFVFKWLRPVSGWS